MRKSREATWFGLVLMVLMPVIVGYSARADSRSVTQWAPYLEWSAENPSYSGNPFDVVASVLFRHGASGETRSTEMFYAGGNTWKWRFTGTRVGDWTYITSSSDPDLDGKSGSVTVTPNNNAKIKGFMVGSGNKFAIMSGDDGSKRDGYLFNVYNRDQYFQLRDWPTDSKSVASRTKSYLSEAMSNGAEVIFMIGRNNWFKFGAEGWSDHSSDDPDLTTFSIIETMIVTAHENGGRVHFWMWGDDEPQRRWSPVGRDGGINGRADKRLQRYIAARLGPLAGWSMEYGFDLHEWVSDAQVEEWASYLHSKMGWPHLLAARNWELNSPGNNFNAFAGNDESKGPLVTSNDHGPDDYAEIAAAMRKYTSRPNAYTERHLYNRWTGLQKMTMERSRRMLWWLAMSGGMGGWYGFDNNSDQYPNPEQLRTHYAFWHTKARFSVDLQVDNAISDGLALRSRNNDKYVFYKEDAQSVQLDLSAMSGDLNAVAVDVKKAYSEIDLGSFSPEAHVWVAPYKSDWAIAVGYSGQGGGDGGPGQSENNAPQAQDLSVSTDTGTPIDIKLIASDVDGDEINYSITKQPSFGAVTGSAPNVRYTPNAPFVGTDSFKYRASDGLAQSNEATVVIEVVAVEAPGDTEPPTAPKNLRATSVGVAEIALAWDASSDNEGVKEYRVYRKAQVVGSVEELKFIDVGLKAGASYRYRVVAVDAAGNVSSNSNIIDVKTNTVNEPANTPPVATSQEVNVKQDKSVSITLQATDADDDVVTYEVTDLPKKGTLSGDPPEVVYTPNAGYSGSDQFSFVASDGADISQKGTISITVEKVAVGDEIETQNISLNAGWNLISSRLRPQKVQIEEVFQTVLPDLIAVKNSTGQIYLPSEDINDIGQWDEDQGYLVLMASDKELIINGTALDPESSPIHLQEGWNLIPFRGSSSVNIGEALAPIASKLQLLKDGFGRIYYPEFGIQQVSTLSAGSAYYVFVQESVDLYYPASAYSKTGVVNSSPELVPNQSLPVSSTLIVLGEHLEDGSTVFVKTLDGVEVGQDIVADGRAVVAVRGDEPFTKDIDEGASAGELLVLEVESKRGSRKLQVHRLLDLLTNTAMVPSQLNFQTDAVWLAETADAVDVDQSGELPDQIALDQNYPNPFNPSTTIRFSVPKAGHVQLSIFNMMGQLQEVLLDNTVDAGFHQVVFDASDFVSGIYVYRLTMDGYSITKQMALVK